MAAAARKMAKYLARATAEANSFRFRCMNGKMILIDEDIAMEFEGIKEQLIKGTKKQVYTFWRLPREIMHMVVHYCEHHRASRNALASMIAAADGFEGPEYEERRKEVEVEMLMIEEWDEQFVEDNKDYLFGLRYAADCLGVMGLKELVSKAMVEKRLDLPSDEMPSDEGVKPKTDENTHVMVTRSKRRRRI